MLLIPIFVWAVVWQFRQRRREHDVWAAYAAEHAWTFYPGLFQSGYRIAGTKDRIDLAVEVLQGNGGWRRATARIHVDLPAKFACAPVHGAHTHSRWLGSAIVKTHDTELDREVVFVGQDAAQVLHLVRSPGMRSTVLELVRANHQIEDGRVIYYCNYPLSTQPELHTVVDRLVTITLAVEAAARSAGTA